MNDEKTIQLDRMRFTKNTMSSNLALLAILFDVLFFISIYEFKFSTLILKIIGNFAPFYNATITS